MSYRGPGIYAPSTGVPGIPPVPLSQPKNLFRYGEQSLWSTYLFANSTTPATGEFRLFSTAIGGTGQGFTNAISIGETNLQEAGRIPNGVAYDVFGVAAHVGASDSTADSGDLCQALDTDQLIQELLNIQFNTVLSWRFTQSNIDIAPVQLIGAGGGAFGAISTTQTNTDRGHFNNGASAVWLYRKHPIALPGSTTFAILARFGSRAAAIGSSNSVFLRVMLLGYFKNVIEVA